MGTSQKEYMPHCAVESKSRHSRDIIVNFKVLGMYLSSLSKWFGNLPISSPVDLSWNFSILSVEATTVHVLPTPALGNILFTFYFNAVIDHGCWRGSWIFENFSVPFTYPEGPTSEINECLMSIFFQNWDFQKEAHNFPNFLWKTLFKCPQVTDGLIICKNVLLTLWGQLCFP